MIENSKRPWQPTPEDEATHGFYADLVAFERWFPKRITELGCQAGDSFLDAFDTLDKVYLYSLCCELADGGDDE